MEDTMVLYVEAEHLDTMVVLATFIAKHHPSLPITLLSSAAESAAASIAAAAPSITYHRLPSPTLPPNMTKNLSELFFEVPRLNNINLLHTLQEISQKARITAFVIDFFSNSACEISATLNIPTYFYFSAGSPSALQLLYLETIDDTMTVDIGELNDFVEIPGMPLIFSQDIHSDLLSRHNNAYKLLLGVSKNLRKSAGFIVNGFDALEFRAKEAISNGLCVPNRPTPPHFFIGPLIGDIIGDETSGKEHECLKWLDTQPSKSVIFLTFGRNGKFSAKQLKEIAVALENSGHRFLWSVRNPPEMKNSTVDLDVLLPEGFLERSEGRGFVIKSWAPQKEVLSHDSVGGFVTHCGRSSLLEAVWCGVPMIGWPIYAEQRMNRVVMVEDMRIALPLEEAAGGFVTAAELEKRVIELMDSKTGRDMRRRVTELKCSARAAVALNGSSLIDLHNFVQSTTRS